jgi:hypothetical protein
MRDASSKPTPDAGSAGPKPDHPTPPFTFSSWVPLLSRIEPAVAHGLHMGAEPLLALGKSSLLKIRARMIPMTTPTLT